MKEINVKTKFAGRVWIHEKYITLLKEGEALVIKHQDQEMTIEDITENPPQKGEESFVEQYGKDRGKKYYLYGFLFVSDSGEVITPKLKKEKPEARGLLSQCPNCLFCSISVLQNRKEKIVQQHSIGEFNNISKIQCPLCIKKALDGTIMK